MKKKLLFAAKHWEEFLAAAAILVMTATAVSNIVSRYCFNHPFTWAEELQCFCLTWAAFLSAAVGLKKNLHFGLDILVDRMGKFKLVARRIVNFVNILLFALLFVIAVQFMLTTSKQTIFFRLHYRYIILAPVLAFLSMTVWSVIYFIESFTHPDRYAKRYLNAFESENSREEGEKA